MRTSQNGMDLIKGFEGCHLDAYKCPSGIWTIGYGHTNGVYDGMKITQEQAESFLREDLQKYEAKVMKYDSIYKWTQNEFDALVSFAFNIGSIDQLTDKGKRSKTIISNKILEYNKSGGKVLSGLVKRREAEKTLFLSVENIVVQFGMRGDCVLKLQNLLNDKGYVVTADGIFGKKTLQAVNNFQRENNLTEDGIVGSKTWKKLMG